MYQSVTGMNLRLSSVQLYLRKSGRNIGKLADRKWLVQVNSK